MLQWSVLDQLSLAGSVALFTAAAAVTWAAGTRLGHCASEISDRAGSGQALIGMLLLGGVASLPELVMSVTAAAGGDAQLSITTLVGGVPATMAMLAIADAVVGGRPVSVRVRHPVVLVHGAMTIGLLAVVAIAIVVGDVGFAAGGVWSLAIATLYLGVAAALRTQEDRTPWLIDSDDDEAPPARPSSTRPAAPLATATAGWAAITAAAGYGLAITASAIADQSGLGSGMVGTALGGIATSLPELSTMVASLRLRQDEMAFGDAFGTCLFSMMLVYPADLALPGAPLFGRVGPDALVATLLGILTVTVYLVGLLHRGRRPVWRVGVDSLVVAVLYGIGLALIARLA
jgi:cation:H+ antiporter